MGDLYQPMHLGRASDRGGNDIYVKWFGRSIRLHQLWDTQVFEVQKMSFTEYAQYIQDKFSKEKKAFKKQTFAESIFETYKLRNKIYAYDYSNLQAYDYMYEFSSCLEIQLFRAGMQLANLLNEIM